MSHDIQDLLELLKELETRVIDLERLLKDTTPRGAEDSWYWDH